MKSTYQLPPIPPFRAPPSNTVSPSQSCTHDSQPHSLAHAPPSSTAANVRADARSLESAEAIAQLTSFSFNKRRPPPLKHSSRSNLQLIEYDGLSAPCPPSPLVYQQILNDYTMTSPLSSPGPVCPLSLGREQSQKVTVPLRFQPGRTAKQAAVESQYNMKAGLTALQQALSSKNLPNGVLRSISIPPSDVNLTPPATPNPRQSALPQPNGNKTNGFFSKFTNAALPPTPSASPYNKSAALPPTTVSAKSLASHKLHGVFLANYTLGDELGSGGFGFVVQATRNRDSIQCAVKFIYKEKVSQQAWVKDELWGDENDVHGITRTKDGTKRVPLEAYVLKTIRHRGVVSFLDLFEDSTYIYLVMEHHGTPWTASEKENKPPTPMGIVKDVQLTNVLQRCQKASSMTSALKLELGSDSRKSSLSLPTPMPGMMRRSSCDLFECIEQHSRLPERYAKYVFAQLIDVVGCLHYNGFVHRDIKDENIVIDNKFRMKLIDFGSTYLFDYRQEPQTLTRFFGTLNFAAPELIRKGSYQPMAAEVWSLGILLSILVTGESFFHDSEAIKHYKASPPSNPISESCMDLIFRCLAYKPEDRWNCFKLRSHPWLSDCQWPWSDMPIDACCESISRVRKL